MNRRRLVGRLPALLNGLYRWLALQAAKRWVSLGLIAGILVVDLSLPWQGWSFTVRALLDEPCHQATGLVCLGAITRFRGRPPSPRFGWTMLICSNAIDLDHLPLQFGSSMLTAGTPRPYTHALWVAVLLALAALVLYRRSRLTGKPAGAAAIPFGAACGVSAHFLRDIATAQMSLWWPITSAPVQVPYWWYVFAIVAIAVIPIRRYRALCPSPRIVRSRDSRGDSLSILLTFYLGRARDRRPRCPQRPGLGRTLKCVSRVNHDVQ